MFNIVTQTILLPDGRKIEIETGKLARQADGAAVVRMGGTMLLATVCAVSEPKEGTDFFPLSVDYQEKFAAAGRIPGGFIKREGKLSDYEILISRLVDRAIRPMFPDDYICETQINIFLISAEKDTQPDALAGLAASAALAVSDIPVIAPISEVRVAKHKGKLIINPPYSIMNEVTLDFIVGASEENILMVEGEASEISEDEMIEALRFAHEVIKVHCKALKELKEKVGKPTRAYKGLPYDEAVFQKVWDATYAQMYEVATSKIENKKVRKERFQVIENAFLESIANDETIDKEMVKRFLKEIQKKACRNAVLDTNIRLDGRGPKEIRPIYTEVDLLPVPHGSALFTRGETQSLTTVTLGTKLDEQSVDAALYQESSKFILHYNFPGFSTGEVKPNRAPGRREIGHGNLAHRALKRVLPPDSQNPYTIRVVSDILESNGSSSMATVCAGSMALMDAGIKIKNAVSGVAMGMISDAKTGRYVVLTDILGDEDHLGDMDFKVAGTQNGITAVQMDLKVEGLTFEIMREALMQAKEGRLYILAEMNKTISEPRPDYKPQAPRSTVIEIPLDQIGAVIGPGGKIIQGIQKETGAIISIEETPTCGLVNIFCSDAKGMEKAIKAINSIVAVPIEGAVYDGIVKSIQPFGAFVEFLKGKEGLLHISEIDHKRIDNLEGVLEIGEEIKVKLLEIDKKSGKFRLSRKALLPKK
ncbi:MAG: polyribonucleotide nucleotidyltransferase [Cytophagales bacterium]|nr:polyribonucleotide nucleotidyltransferase [Cytophagales bacterium]MDW8383488.1 polyribonucleotide nucleotidyltransferase [Flammeovirgaceae bacterium]